MIILDTVEIIGIAAAVIFAITFHEFAHGYVANAFGDDTAKRLGRLTVNPVKHIDPVGTVLLPASLFLMHKLIPGMPLVLFGWAKPVPVQRHRLAQPRVHMPVVALAGPGSNLLQAFVWAILYKCVTLTGFFDSMPLVHGIFTNIVMSGIFVNVILMCLNLLPILPLDGGRALIEYLPRNLAARYARLEPFGIFIVLLLVLWDETSNAFFNIVTSVTYGIQLAVNL